MVGGPRPAAQPGGVSQAQRHFDAWVFYAGEHGGVLGRGAHPLWGGEVPGDPSHGGGAGWRLGCRSWRRPRPSCPSGSGGPDAPFLTTPSLGAVRWR